MIEEFMSMQDLMNSAEFDKYLIPSIARFKGLTCDQVLELAKEKKLSRKEVVTVIEDNIENSWGEVYELK